MGGTISVIMSGIHLNRLEKERVMLLKPKFYKRFVNKTITKRKKNTDIDELFQNMNSTIRILNWLLKLTQLDFWIQLLAKILMVLLRLRFISNPKNFQYFGILKYQKDISIITFEVTCIVLLKLLQILMQKFRQSHDNI